MFNIEAQDSTGAVFDDASSLALAWSVADTKLLMLHTPAAAASNPSTISNPSRMERDVRTAVALSGETLVSVVSAGYDEKQLASLGYYLFVFVVF